MSDSVWTHGLYSPRDSPGHNTGVGSQPFPSPGDLPNSGIKPRSPALQADSLPAELPGKPCYLLSCVQLFATPWTIACQAPLSMKLSRQEDWSGLPCPSPGDLPDLGIKPRSPTLQVDSLPLSHQGNSFCWLVVTFLMNCFFKLSAYFSSGKLCIFLSNLWDC